MSTKTCQRLCAVALAALLGVCATAVVAFADTGETKSGVVETTTADNSLYMPSSSFGSSDRVDTSEVDLGDTEDVVSPDEQNDGVTGFVTRLYQIVLERIPDEGGLNAHCAALLSGVSAAEIAKRWRDGVCYEVISDCP
ncbi:DUF4214 domain-containing protein [Adlercreutzia sp. ZJ141]|uniref:DUF4214 domain-containing protein n=1 Tax=Adlercreutzia sp. ZJ141 TaxID=2709406 RepID=UPI0013ED4FCA|nr:DUF4214 domain-containing protein [Adlercreutzia sp. ZJ141]